MKKNTKIIVWSAVGLAVAVGAFFGIRSLVKKAKARKMAIDTPLPIVTKEMDSNKQTGEAITHGSPNDKLVQEIKDQKLTNKFNK